MKSILLIIFLNILFNLFSSFQKQEVEMFPLTVKVEGLRNSKGVVQFALYNSDEIFPDEHYKNYYRRASAKIVNGTSTITFANLPAGKYAVNILHDENNDGKIKKGFILPVEGIGFSNYQSIGISNRLVFQKASFELLDDTKMNVRIIYF